MSNFTEISLFFKKSHLSLFYKLIFKQKNPYSPSLFIYTSIFYPKLLENSLSKQY